MVPEQLFENMVLSVRSYLDTNWKTGSPLAPITRIEWPDSQFDAGNVREWIQPTVIKGARIFRRQTRPGRLGAELPLLINVNIYLKRDFLERGNPSRRLELIDYLFDLFKEGRAIPFKDYVGNSSSPAVLGVLQCYDFAETRLALDEAKALYQHNCTATLMALEEREP
jgi:hypothetical protein